MVLAATLLAGALLAALFAPRALARLDARGSDPGLGMASWLLALSSVVVTAGAGLVLVLVPGHGAGSVFAAAVYNCWSTVRHGGIPRLDEAVGAVGVLAALLAVGRSALVAGRDARRRRRRNRDHLDALALVGQPDAEGTVWIPSARPAAFCLPGRRRLVVATTALKELPSPAREAVLAHERAHLAGRHHLLLVVADALCAAAPALPLFRQAPLALRELVELAADRSASRRWGATAVKQALLVVTGTSAPPQALAMRTAISVAGRIAALDGQLAATPPRAPGLRRFVRRGVTSGAAVLLPVAGAAALLSALALVSCS